MPARTACRELNFDDQRTARRLRAIRETAAYETAKHAAIVDEPRPNPASSVLAEAISASILDWFGTHGTRLVWSAFSDNLRWQAVATQFGLEAELSESTSRFFDWVVADGSSELAELEAKELDAFARWLARWDERHLGPQDLRSAWELWSALTRSLGGLPHALAQRTRWRAKLHQAATVGDEASLDALVADLGSPPAASVSDGVATFESIVLRAIVQTLFAGHRIRSIGEDEIDLEALPQDPERYHFEVLGCSPPWGVGEEMAWLLDAHGFHRRSQPNVISVANVLRILMLQRRRFHRSNSFYVGWDQTRDVVFGSPFSGGGRDTVTMGAQLAAMAANTVAHSGRPRLRPAADFRKHPQFERVFAAYSAIRANYFSFAYYSAFLEGRRDWVRRALLLSASRDGFTPLGPGAHWSLDALFGIPFFIARIPGAAARFAAYLRRVIDRNLDVIRSEIAELDDVLSDGRTYLLGDEFTAVDVHICANLSALIVPDEFQGGGVFPPLEQYPDIYRRGIEEIRATPTGQYALRVYREHRGPRRAP